MGADRFAFTQAEALLSQLDASRSEAHRSVLGEYLKNPFLDDDVHALALRTDLSREVLAPVLAEMRDAGLLQSAGRRGHMLDAQAIDSTPDGDVAEPQSAEVHDEVAVDHPGLALAPLLDILPCGVALLDCDEDFALANEAFCRSLGLSADGLNAAQIAERVGGDLRVEVGGKPVIIDVEKNVRVQLRSYSTEAFDGVLATVMAADMGWEVSRAQVQIQEELFAQLRNEVAGPAGFLQSFLEKPKKSDLGVARAAIERINACLALFMLDDPPDGNSVS